MSRDRGSCPSCTAKGCFGGRITDDYGHEDYCECECHGEFCPLCETIHKRGQRCRQFKPSQVSREKARERAR